MEVGLSLDNILVSDDVENLFIDTEEDIQSNNSEDNTEEEKKEIETTEVDVDNLFTEEPESVGSEDETKVKEGPKSKKDKSTSPNNFYSSIAKAFAEEGIFPDLNDDSIKDITSPEDLKSLISQQIQNSLEDKQKRIDEALSLGVEPDEIKRYESTLEYLESIDNDLIEAETEAGETLRKQLIYQDYINRGYTKSRAEREIKKSFDAGTDVEDAIEALNSNVEFYQDSYTSVINERKKQEEQRAAELQKQADELKKNILESKQVFGDIEIDPKTRQKVYDNISKPVYKDKQSGMQLTAIQKYQKENQMEFIKNIGIIYTLTDGFKDLNGILKNKVKKEVNKGFRELEHTLNNTSRTPGGAIDFASGLGESNSYIGKGISLDI